MSFKQGYEIVILPTNIETLSFFPEYFFKSRRSIDKKNKKTMLYGHIFIINFHLVFNVKHLNFIC